MKKYLWAAVFSAALTAFTAYAALDTFVLEDRMQTDATEMNTAMFDNVEKKEITRSGSSDTAGASKGDASDENTDGDESSTGKNTDKGSGRSRGKHGKGSDGGVSDDAAAKNAGNVTADGSKTYDDENMSITLSEYYENGTKIYVADVQVTSAEYVKSAFAEDTYGKNVTEHTSDIAERVNAVLAVNGDYYGARERGIVIRNGIVYREASSGGDILCLYADGTMKIVSSDDKSADELVSEGVWQAWDFGPALVEDGSVAVSEGEEVGKAMASNPRTAIGMIDSCHYLFVVSDGRTSESEGLSLHELAEFMQSLGAETAYNLDGGGSSTMVFQGDIVNNPTTNGSVKERSVSDIIYLG